MRRRNTITGASDTEIKIGNIMPYSGPASAYGTIGKAEAAYFNKINAEGGINGRKINFISYDDAFSPPKAVEQARKLVESDEVLLIFQPLGTQSNSATQKYMNAKKVPQLFVATGATKWGDPQNFPWTMGWQPNYQSEGRIYAAYILQEFSERQDRGALAERRRRQGPDEGLARRPRRQGQHDHRRQILRGLRSHHRFADRRAEGFRRRHLHDMGGAEGRGAGDPQGRRARLEAGVFPRQRLDLGCGRAQAGRPRKFQGHHLDRLHQGPDRSLVEGRSGHQGLVAFMDKYFPDGDKTNNNNVYGYATAQTMVQVLKQCGDNLTRENVMKQAASLKNFTSDVLLPGITINTGPNDFFPIEQMQLMKFNGESWELFGEIIAGEVGH